MTHIKFFPGEDSNLNFPLKMGIFTNYTTRASKACICTKYLPPKKTVKKNLHLHCISCDKSLIKWFLE